jgi:hypothetical protein
VRKSAGHELRSMLKNGKISSRATRIPSNSRVPFRWCAGVS